MLRFPTPEVRDFQLPASRCQLIFKCLSVTLWFNERSCMLSVSNLTHTHWLQWSMKYYFQSTFCLSVCVSVCQYVRDIHTNTYTFFLSLSFSLKLKERLSNPVFPYFYPSLSISIVIPAKSERNCLFYYSFICLLTIYICTSQIKWTFA